MCGKKLPETNFLDMFALPAEVYRQGAVNGDSVQVTHGNSALAKAC